MASKETTPGSGARRGQSRPGEGRVGDVATPAWGTPLNVDWKPLRSQDAASETSGDDPSFNDFLNQTAERQRTEEGHRPGLKERLRRAWARFNLGRRAASDVFNGGRSNIDDTDNVTTVSDKDALAYAEAIVAFKDKEFDKDKELDEVKKRLIEQGLLEENISDFDFHRFITAAGRRYSELASAAAKGGMRVEEYVESIQSQEDNDETVDKDTQAKIDALEKVINDKNISGAKRYGAARVLENLLNNAKPVDKTETAKDDKKQQPGDKEHVSAETLEKQADEARRKFVEAKINYEEGFFKNWFGGAKRRAAMEEARRELTTALTALVYRQEADSIKTIDGKFSVDKEKTKPSTKDNPEGLDPYEEARRQTYLGDEYDEGEESLIEESQDKEKTKPSTKDNPEGLDPYEEARRQTYLGDEYDEGEESLIEESQADEKKNENEASYEQARKAAIQSMALAVVEQLDKVERSAEDELRRRQKERSPFRKLVAKIGRLFTSGEDESKITIGSLHNKRSTVSGVASGLVAGGATGLAGFSMLGMLPVAAGGALLSAGIGAAAREATLEAQSEDDRSLTDEEKQEFIESASNNEWTVGDRDKDGNEIKRPLKSWEMIGAMVGSGLEMSQMDSEIRQEASRDASKGAMARYALGFATGGAIGFAAGHWAHDRFFSPEGTPSDSSEPPKPPLKDKTDDLGMTSSRHNIAENPMTGTPMTEAPTISSDTSWPWDHLANNPSIGSEKATSTLYRVGDWLREQGFSVDFPQVGNGEIGMTVGGNDNPEYVNGAIDWALENMNL